MTATNSHRATISVAEPTEQITVSPDIYGQYFEHVEDCIYPGVMDDDGIREDVVAAASDLQVPVVRWPGGCFADCYHWEEGIGPLDQRPVRPNWHWGGGQLENHRFGTHEFLDWCERVGAAAYINVNMGTGTMIEALRWLDYTTGTQETTDVATRRRHGRDEPWEVAYWGIGNETWGSWEAGRMSAAAYADKLANWADFFRRYQRDVRIVAVGSEAGQDPQWDQTVLDVPGDQIDLLSIHIYGARVDRADGAVLDESDRRAVMLALLHFEAQIAEMGRLVRAHNATASRQIGIALDEWNIRHYREAGDTFELDRAAPRIGTDAIFSAGVFHAMLRAADLVTMANYVFLVNGNAVLDARNGTVTRSTLFTMFSEYRKRLCGTLLDVDVEGHEIDVPELYSGNPSRSVDPETVPGRVPAIDAAATRDSNGALQIAVLNRSEDPVEVTLTLPGAVSSATADCYRVNVDTDTLEQLDPVAFTDGRVTVPSASCTLIAAA